MISALLPSELTIKNTVLKEIISNLLHLVQLDLIEFTNGYNMHRLHYLSYPLHSFGKDRPPPLTLAWYSLSLRGPVDKNCDELPMIKEYIVSICCYSK